MTVEIVLTVIARDRPGLVERVSEVIARHQGNWVDSSMARLGGEFAGILMIELPEASLAALEADLAGLAAAGIHRCRGGHADGDRPRQPAAGVRGGVRRPRRGWPARARRA